MFAEPEFIDALTALWRIPRPGPENLWRILGSSASRSSVRPYGGARLSFSLSSALRSLRAPLRFASRSEAARAPAARSGAQAGACFSRASTARRHLCPLDFADELPELAFGSAKVSLALTASAVDRVKRRHRVAGSQPARLAPWAEEVANPLSPIDRAANGCFSLTAPPAPTSLCFRETPVAETSVKTQRFIGWGGVTLVADVGGPQGGAPVILMHGGGQTRGAWKKATATLAEAGYLAISLDLRGHGESDWASDANYSLDAFAADLRAVASNLNQPPALVGASLGGMSALLAMGAGLEAGP